MREKERARVRVRESERAGFSPSSCSAGVVLVPEAVTQKYHAGLCVSRGNRATRVITARFRGGVSAMLKAGVGPGTFLRAVGILTTRPNACPQMYVMTMLRYSNVAFSYI